MMGVKTLIPKAGMGHSFLSVGVTPRRTCRSVFVISATTVGLERIETSPVFGLVPLYTPTNVHISIYSFLQYIKCLNVKGRS